MKRDIELSLIMAKKVKTQRQKAKISQEDLAYIIGVSRVSICNIESGIHGLTTTILLKLIAVFKCDPYALLPTPQEYAPYLRDEKESLSMKNSAQINKLQARIELLKAKQQFLTPPIK